MSDLSAVMGASTTVKTMADGSLRLAIDIEPRHAQQAFALFGSPGTPVALARITNEAANAFEKREPEPEKPKGGELSVLAGRLCKDPEFHRFARQHVAFEDGDDARICAEWIRQECGIESRAELDHNDAAAETFHRVIRGPWIKWRAARGLK